MGIDIYAWWPRQTKDEKTAQCTGFSVVDGDVGYLREAYHGEPYATRYLVREAFDAKNGKAKISAKKLRARLPKTVELAIQREREVYENKAADGNTDVVQTYVKFVELCEQKEAETGEPCTIIASY